MAEISGDKIIGIEEKPKHPKSNYAVTGIYMYDASVFEKVRTLVPSSRGELEITDVNNAYIREGTMSFSWLNGWWTDAGTFESLLRAGNLVAQSSGTGTQAEGAGQALNHETARHRRRRLYRLGIYPAVAGGSENLDTIVNLDKLTYAGNLENLESVAGHPQYGLCAAIYATPAWSSAAAG